MLYNKYQGLIRIFVYLRISPVFTAGAIKLSANNSASSTVVLTFLDKLFLNGTILLGGPLADNSRIVLSANAKNEGELRIIFKDDPFVKNGILAVEHILEWNLQHHSELVEEND